MQLVGYWGCGDLRSTHYCKLNDTWQVFEVNVGFTPRSQGCHNLSLLWLIQEQAHWAQNELSSMCEQNQAQNRGSITCKSSVSTMAVAADDVIMAEAGWAKCWIPLVKNNSYRRGRLWLARTTWKVPAVLEDYWCGPPLLHTVCHSCALAIARNALGNGLQLMTQFVGSACLKQGPTWRYVSVDTSWLLLWGS